MLIQLLAGLGALTALILIVGTLHVLWDDHTDKTNYIELKPTPVHKHDREYGKAIAAEVVPEYSAYSSPRIILSFTIRHTYMCKDCKSLFIEESFGISVYHLDLVNEYIDKQKRPHE